MSSQPKAFLHFNLSGCLKSVFELFINFALFLLVAFLIYKAILAGLIDIPILDRLYRSPYPLPALFLCGAAGSALVGLAASFFRERDIPIKVFGYEIKPKIPKAVVPYLFKAPWWLVTIVAIGTIAWPAYLLMQSNCVPPEIFFQVEVAGSKANYHAHDIINVKPNTSLTIQPQFTTGIPKGTGCTWLRSGGFIDSIAPFTDCKSTVFVKDGTGVEMVVLDATASVCQTRTIVPLLFSIQ